VRFFDLGFRGRGGGAGAVPPSLQRATPKTQADSCNDMTDPYREEDEALFRAAVQPIAQLLYDLGDDLVRATEQPYAQRSATSFGSSLGTHALECMLS
jgi:hypothetical protein